MPQRSRLSLWFWMTTVFVSSLPTVGCNRKDVAAQAAALGSARQAQARAESELKAVKEAAAAAPPASVPTLEPATPRVDAPTAQPLAPSADARLNAHCGCQDPSCVCVSVIVSLTVDARKPGSKDWDGLGGAPDPVISLRAPSGSHTSKVFQEQVFVQGSFSVMPLTPGDQLRFDVADQDATVNDPIGTFAMTFRGMGTTAKGRMDGAAIEVSFRP